MTDPNAGMPFAVGTKVVFYPDDRTIGWDQHSFERWGLIPGDLGTISEIVDSDYVVVDGRKEAALHWSQFRKADIVSQAEISAVKNAWIKRLRVSTMH